MVRCFPEVLLDAERLARRRVTKEIKLALVVEALYTEPAAADDEPVPEPWVSEQIEWVETQLFDRVNNKGVLENDLLGNRFRMMNCEWAAVYDVDRLINSKLFWSLINLTYHEQAVVG
jgi:hypothetical protein